MAGGGQSWAFGGTRAVASAGFEDTGSVPAPLTASVLSRVARAVVGEIEAEQERWFLWVAVAFGTGAALYFAADVEPPLWGLAVGAGAVAVAHGFVRRVGLWGLASGFILAMALGGVAGKLRTEFMREPVLARPIGSVQVKGWVELVEPRATGGQRITIQVQEMERLPRAEWPWRVRVVTRSADATLAPGQFVRVRATLGGPQPPSLPGDFDFGRYAWFYALGGTGLAAGPVVAEATTATPPLTLQLKALNEGIRYWITRRIMDGLPGETGAIAAALITGERGGITTATNNAYRNSGLFHILSISGLHMVVMAGAIFALIRVTLAAFAPVALNYPIKKWAAGGALVGALAYLLISGASFATVRSYLMISVMFLAVMLDRKAVSLRNVALSAILILVVYPESVFDPGFQMSYAAVTGLIAVYEWMADAAERRQRAFHEPGPIGRVMAHLGGSLVSTVIASVAVAPFGIYHFHNTQLMAMLANLVALPLCDMYVMPLALATLIALPFGLEHWPLVAAGWGIDAMTWIAGVIGALPISVVRIPSIPQHAFLGMVVGGLWLLLWRRPWRLLGLLPVALGLLAAPGQSRPDVMVSRDGATVAVRGNDGRLTAVAVRGGLFELARWLEYDGDGRKAQDVAAAQGFQCDALGCVITAGGREVAILTGAAALRDHCGRSAVIVMRFLVPPTCQGTEPPAVTAGAAPQRVVIDPAATRAGNGQSLYFKADGIEVRTVEGLRGMRPWSRSGVIAAAEARRRDAALVGDRPPRETDVPFAVTPSEIPRGGDDEGRPTAGAFP